MTSLCVHGPDEKRILRIHPIVYAVLAYKADGRTRDHVIRVGVFRFFRRLGIALDFVDTPGQLRRGADQCRVQICHETGRNLRAVAVGDILIRNYAAGRWPDPEHRQVGCEKKIPDLVLLVKRHDLRNNRKRGIIDDDTAIGVCVPHVIAARIKRPYKIGAIQAVLLGNPFGNRIIHWLRRIAVIRRLFRFEFFDELPVFLRYVVHPHLRRYHRHPPGHYFAIFMLMFSLPAFNLVFSAHRSPPIFASNCKKPLLSSSCFRHMDAIPDLCL